MTWLHTRRNVGLVLRTFSGSPSQVEKNVLQTAHAAKTALDLMIGGRHVFKTIHILVAGDKSRIDHDCGESAPRLRTLFDGQSPVEVHEIANGDLYCGLLNFGITSLIRENCDYVAVLSHGASQYLTPENVSALFHAFEENGAKAAGLAIEELQSSILEGRLANTFALWDAVALMSVGGFDLRAAQPKVTDRTAPYLRGNGSELYYPLAGVEEAIPLKRLIDEFGKCIAPIMPHGTARWEAPDKVSDPEGRARHDKKMGTKFERQCALLASVGADLSYLRYGVLDQYAPR
jgi:hypothetical protein